MRSAYFLGLAVVLVVGCSEDDPSTTTSTAAGAGGGTASGTTTTTQGSGGATTSSSAGGAGGGTTSTGEGGAGGAGGTSPTSATGSGGADACGGIGEPCQPECAAGLVCRGDGPSAFCAPPSDDCGGFAGALCPDTHPECLHFSNADYGVCATPVDAQCICDNAPSSVTGC